MNTTNKNFRLVPIADFFNVMYVIGIVPITCEELFKGIEAKKGSEAEYQVVLNMLEIYNEQVYNYLLQSNTD